MEQGRALLLNQKARQLRTKSCPTRRPPCPWSTRLGRPSFTSSYAMGSETETCFRGTKLGIPVIEASEAPALHPHIQPNSLRQQFEATIAGGPHKYKMADAIQPDSKTVQQLLQRSHSLSSSYAAVRWTTRRRCYASTCWSR
jgi:hypothetical protein